MATDSFTGVAAAAAPPAAAAVVCVDCAAVDGVAADVD